MNMLNHVAIEYLKDHKYAWAQTTQRNEEYRLFSVLPLLDGKPETLWEALVAKGMKPYSRVTTWTRVSDFWDWALKNGHIQGVNVYEAFREKNARLFKNAYEKHLPQISYDEAKRLIGKIADDRAREASLKLLEGGLRISEVARISNDGTVVGKGSKKRRVYVTPLSFSPTNGDYRRVRAELKRLGLHPHMLRKCFLSRLVENEANEFELCEVAGWSSLQTASSYVKANSNRIASLVKKVQGNSTHGKVLTGVSDCSEGSAA